MLCKKCGKIIKENTEYCGECKQQLKKDIKEFDKKIKETPSNITFYIKIIKAFEAIQEYDKIEEYYNKFLDIQPNNIDILLKRGKYFLDFEKYDQAIEDFEKVIKLDPKNAMAHACIVYCGIQDDFTEEIIFEHYNKAIELEPDNLDIYSMIDEIMKIKPYCEIKTYEVFIKRNSNNINGFKAEISFLEEYYIPNLNNAYRNEIFYEEDYEYCMKRLLEDYNELIKFDTNNKNKAGYYCNLGYIFKNLEQYDEAIQNYNKGIEINSAVEYIGNIDLIGNCVGGVYSGRGYCYYRLKQYDKALEDYNKEQYNEYNLYEKGYCHYKLGQYEKAIKNFNKIIDEYSYYYQNFLYDVHLYRGYSYFALKQYQKSFEDFKYCEKQVHEDPEIQLAKNFSKILIKK